MTIIAIVEDIKRKINGEVVSETELENLMAEFGYSPLNSDDDAENLIKYTNFKCQIWIDAVRDEENNLLCENIRQVTKEKGEENYGDSTDDRTEPGDSGVQKR